MWVSAYRAREPIGRSTGRRSARPRATNSASTPASLRQPEAEPHVEREEDDREPWHKHQGRGCCWSGEREYQHCDAVGPILNGKPPEDSDEGDDGCEEEQRVSYPIEHVRVA